MVNLISKAAIATVVFFAILYQFVFKNLLFNIIGYGRHVQSIKDFNHVSCTKVDELGLEGCEDLLLHEKTGYLYMACSDSRSRTQWLPAVDHLNATARSLTDRIAILDTRGAGHIRDRIRWLSIENFSGINGDGTINLHGFDIKVDKHSDVLRMLVINHRPPIDPVTGEALDATLVGANSTIEHFITRAGSSAIRHVRTTFDPLIQTPNNVAWVSDHSFVVSNDHSAKVGLRRKLDPLLGGGNVVYCSRNKCNIAWSSGFIMPNGLVHGRDGLIYVPSTSGGFIDVFSLDQDHTFRKLDTIKTLPIDNLSVDKNGDIYAAGMPQIWKWIRNSKAPFDYHPGSTVLKISRGGEGYKGTGRQGHFAEKEGKYVVERVTEDNGTVLPGATTAVHDAETGRIFLGGAISPYITICETRGI